MAENDTRVESLEDEVKVLKGEVRRTLVDLRALLMREDSPLNEGSLGRRSTPVERDPNEGSPQTPVGVPETLRQGRRGVLAPQTSRSRTPRRPCRTLHSPRIRIRGWAMPPRHSEVLPPLAWFHRQWGPNRGQAGPAPSKHKRHRRHRHRNRSKGPPSWTR